MARFIVPLKTMMGYKSITSSQERIVKEKSAPFAF
jgi:hypothetical protein